VLVNEGEGQAEMVLAVSEEVSLVVGHVLAELILLEFPNVQLLAAVAVGLNTFG
jgi:hypothetical protein